MFFIIAFPLFPFNQSIHSIFLFITFIFHFYFISLLFHFTSISYLFHFISFPVHSVFSVFCSLSPSGHRLYAAPHHPLSPTFHARFCSIKRDHKLHIKLMVPLFSHNAFRFRQEPPPQATLAAVASHRYKRTLSSSLSKKHIILSIVFYSLTNLFSDIKSCYPLCLIFLPFKATDAHKNDHLFPNNQ